MDQWESATPCSAGGREGLFSQGIFRVHAGLLQHTSLGTACKQEQGVMGACPAVAS